MFCEYVWITDHEILYHEVFSVAFSFRWKYYPWFFLLFFLFLYIYISFFVIFRFPLFFLIQNDSAGV